MKNVSIVMRGQGGENAAVRDLEIDPGAERKDILKALQLPTNYSLRRMKTKDLLVDGIDLHKALDNGEKLEAAMAADLGTPIG